MAKALKRFIVSFSLMERPSKRGQRNPAVLLTPEETHHLRNVLRIREGNVCLLCDPKGHEVVGRVERFQDGTRAELRLIEAVPNDCETPLGFRNVGTHRARPLLHLSVAQAIPQDRNMDRIVEKAAELGIFELIPLVTERTIVRMQSGRFQKVCERWGRIANQTLKQSRIKTAPKINPPTSFEMVCSNLSQYDRVFLLHPSSDAESIRDQGAGLKPAPTNGGAVRILLLIGPEGGFSPGEVKRAGEAGVKLVKLGSGILKTDTAFVAAVSFLKLMYGD